MTSLYIFMILSYVLIFIGGFIFGRDHEKGKQEKIHEARNRWVTYDEEGRIRQ